jgi:tungstate transport system substrate-binding protein
VDFQGIGSRELTHTLWRLAGGEPKGPWGLKDEAANPWDVLQYARSNNAYVVVGYMPARFGKMLNTGMKIMVKGDPRMRRPYIVMEANPKRFRNANAAGARAFSDFLLSEKVQKFLLEFGTKTNGSGRQLFFPVETVNETTE